MAALGASLLPIAVFIVLARFSADRERAAALGARDGTGSSGQEATRDGPGRRLDNRSVLGLVILVPPVVVLGMLLASGGR